MESEAVILSASPNANITSVIEGDKHAIFSIFQAELYYFQPCLYR
ncbi:hypothetical protein [Brachyspira hampsonii]|nr:hypothetical protein [Brachyspira hampsonii]